MKKNIISTLLVLTIIICLVFPANASDLQNEECISIENASEMFREDLAKRGIVINESTQVSITQVIDKLDGSRHFSFLITTWTKENEISTDVVTYFDSNAKVIDASMENAVNPKGVGIATHAAFAVTTNTTYYAYTFYSVYTYYCPQSLSIIMTTLNNYIPGNHSLTANYYCGGVLKTNPGLVFQDGSYTHNITITRTNPSNNTKYTNASNPLSTAYVIDADTGLFAGHVVNIYGSYRGASYSLYTNP